MKLPLVILLILVPVLGKAQDVPPQHTEHLVFDWPRNEHWKMATDKENKYQHIVDMLHEPETLDNWTELVNLTSVYGVKNVPMDTAMNVTFRTTARYAPEAKLTFIKKGEIRECPWIMFTIEAPRYKRDATPESQLWFVVQGKEALYTNFAAVKSTSVTPDFRKKWIAFFEKGKLAYSK